MTNETCANCGLTKANHFFKNKSRNEFIRVPNYKGCKKFVPQTQSQDKSERSKSSDDQTSKKSRISSSNSDTQTPEDKIKHPRTLDWDNEAKVWSRKRYGKEGIKLEFYYFKPTSGNVNFIITRENAEELVKELNIILKRLR